MNVSEKTPVNVAVGIVINKHNQCLISYRHKHQHVGDCWEFPGGKVELDESPLTALKRELKEEVGIQPTSAEFLMTINHEYPDKCVELHVWQVNHFDGMATGNEGQVIQWVELEALNDFKISCGEPENH